MRTCDNCGAELTPMFPDIMRRRSDYPQYEDALIVELRGGYGMYIDPMDAREDTRTILCKDCAEFLEEHFPVAFRNVATLKPTRLASNNPDASWNLPK